VSDRYSIFNQDCIPGMAERLAPDSVNLCVSSIPFGALFMYSGKATDIGNNPDGVDMRASQFGLHLRFAVEQLFRVMEPGAITCIHIQQLVTTKVQHGVMGRRDLRGATVDLLCAGGFDWTGEFVIPKNPQAMAQRMKLHSLLFITGKRDARALAPAMNDYVLVFRKPGEGTPVPALWDGEVNPSGWLSTEEWIRDARGLWADIRETDVLTGWRDAREEDDEKHVCPLQLEVIRRCVRLWSNPDGLVLDPFMGIGSTAVVALEQGRRAVGFELKESYYEQAVRNCERELERQRAEQALPLFSLAGVTVAD
jgi:DNA modification methylase